MLKRTKIFLALTIIWCWLGFFNFMITFVGTASGDVCLNYNGFGVDDKGNLYLGYERHIVVLNENGERINEFRTQTEYITDFLIVDNEYIYEYSNKRYFAIMDLNGKLISKSLYGEEGYRAPPNGDWPLSTHTNESGTAYESFKKLGRFEVYRVENGSYELIYRMPLYDYVIKLCGIVFPVGMFVVIPIFLYCYYTDPKAPKTKSLFE